MKETSKAKSKVIYESFNAKSDSFAYHTAIFNVALGDNVAQFKFVQMCDNSYYRYTLFRMSNNGNWCDFLTNNEIDFIEYVQYSYGKGEKKLIMGKNLKAVMDLVCKIA